MTQTADILHHLKKIGPITPIEALNRYGSFRLGARIWDLRQDGHPIIKTMIDVGNGKRVAQYSMGSREGGPSNGNS